MSEIFGDPIAEAEFSRDSVREQSLASVQVAQCRGLAREVVVATLQLLNLPLEVRQCIRAGLMGVACSRILWALEHGADQLQLARRCIAENMRAEELSGPSPRNSPITIEQAYHPQPWRRSWQIQ